ncbi:hypothetical protein, partial [Klebsiella pneumoniae]|uniref:hypothetical protein n=1 Tax=Klebsiella pneumoniae TaxID=573 RepID=UPI001D0D8190
RAWQKVRFRSHFYGGLMASTAKADSDLSRWPSEGFFCMLLRSLSLALALGLLRCKQPPSRFHLSMTVY